MNIQQYKTDRENGVIIHNLAWDRLIEHSLEQEKELKELREFISGKAHNETQTPI